MKTIKNYSLLLLVLFFSIVKAQQPPSSEDYDYDTFEAQKKWIVGTFLNDDDKNWQLQFTKDGKCHERFLITDSKPEEYTYTIEYSTKKSDVPAGYENIYTLYLKAIPADPNEDLTYEIYVDGTGLELDPVPMGILKRPFGFSRVKPKESTSSKTPSKEEEKESEVSPRWELKSSDYDKGYFDGGSAYEQCKNKQIKEREFLDRDRQMSMEKMGGEAIEYQAKFQECKKRFFDGIRRENESYQEGFKKGWRDAAMLANKEKKHKTKIYNNKKQ